MLTWGFWVGVTIWPGCPRGAWSMVQPGSSRAIPLLDEGTRGVWIEPLQPHTHRSGAGAERDHTQREA